MNYAEIDSYDELDYDPSMMAEQNTDIDELDSESVTLMGLAIDHSGSMMGYSDAMKAALEESKDAFKGSKNADEILISRIAFSEEVKASGYVKIDEMSTEYPEDGILIGMTSLYDAIVTQGDSIRKYRKYLKENGSLVHAVFAVFTDGLDNTSRHSLADAKKMIQELQRDEIVVCMVEFGTEAHGIAEALGINKKITCKATAHELREAFVMISKSVVSVSQNTGSNDADAFAF